MSHEHDGWPDELLETMSRAHDAEESAQRGEPSLWAMYDRGDFEGTPAHWAAYRSERLTCMRVALDRLQAWNEGVAALTQDAEGNAP